MSVEVTFTEAIRKVYTVTDVSPEDGVIFDFSKLMENAKRMNLKRNQKQTHCKKCKKAFKDGDKMYMGITDQGNIFLCKECAKQLRHKLGKKDYCKSENQHLNYTQIKG